MAFICVEAMSVTCFKSQAKTHIKQTNSKYFFFGTPRKEVERFSFYLPRLASGESLGGGALLRQPAGHLAGCAGHPEEIHSSLLTSLGSSLGRSGFMNSGIFSRKGRNAERKALLGPSRCVTRVTPRD